MLTRRDAYWLALMTAGASLAHQNKLFQSISTRDTGQFRGPRECV